MSLLKGYGTYSAVDRFDMRTFLLPRRGCKENGVWVKEGIESVFSFEVKENRLVIDPVRNAFPWSQSPDFNEETTFHVYHDGALFRAELPLVALNSTTKEMHQAHDYWDQVLKLDKSPAGRKAEALLKEFINEQQCKDLDEKGYFWETFAKWDLVRKHGDKHQVYTVVSHQGIWCFDLRNGAGTYHYDRLDREKEPLTFCWHPDEPVPSADILLAHMLYIQNNGLAGMLRNANW